MEVEHTAWHFLGKEVDNLDHWMKAGLLEYNTVSLSKYTLCLSTRLLG